MLSVTILWKSLLRRIHSSPFQTILFRKSKKNFYFMGLSDKLKVTLEILNSLIISKLKHYRRFPELVRNYMVLILTSFKEEKEKLTRAP